MRYFGQAKDRLSRYARERDLSGPGFTMNDAHTMESERSMYAESMDSAVQWAQRKEFGGRVNRDSADTVTDDEYARIIGF